MGVRSHRAHRDSIGAPMALLLALAGGLLVLFVLIALSGCNPDEDGRPDNGVDPQNGYPIKENATCLREGDYAVINENGRRVALVCASNQHDPNVGNLRWIIAPDARQPSHHP